VARLSGATTRPVSPTSPFQPGSVGALVIGLTGGSLGPSGFLASAEPPQPGDHAA